MAVTFINHATVLIQLPGLNVLTDPVWSRRVSPLSWLGPRRVRAPGVRFEELPRIDVVLVSHNHYDHLDKSTIKRLADRFNPRVFVALGDGDLVKSWGVRQVSQLDWENEVRLNSETHVRFTPCQHWSGRSLTDRRRSLWGGYLLTHAGRRIYFGGDAGYSDTYKELRRRFGAMDFSFLPIGAYEPRWFMRDMHMDPTDAVRAHLDLESRRSIGIHFGTWRLTDEGIDEPVLELARAREAQGLDADEFGVLDNGETLLHRFAQPFTRLTTLPSTLAAGANPNAAAIQVKLRSE